MLQAAAAAGDPAAPSAPARLLRSPKAKPEDGKLTLDVETVRALQQHPAGCSHPKGAFVALPACHALPRRVRGAIKIWCTCCKGDLSPIPPLPSPPLPRPLPFPAPCLRS